MSIDLYTLKATSYQNPNLWEFYITDGPPDMKFYVTDTTLPFEKLETETRNTGSKHYTGFVPIEGFSITFREDTSFLIHDYFTAWKNDIYDPIEKVFKTGPGKSKTAILAFQQCLTPFTKTYNKVFQFNNLKIIGIDDKSLDYTTIDAMTLTVSFVADEVSPVNLSVAGLTATIASLSTKIEDFGSALVTSAKPVKNYIDDVKKIL
jgi:hypothetical protein